jgi:hypothetical protein
MLDSSMAGESEGIHHVTSPVALEPVPSAVETHWTTTVSETTAVNHRAAIYRATKHRATDEAASEASIAVEHRC